VNGVVSVVVSPKLKLIGPIDYKVLIVVSKHGCRRVIVND